MSLLCRLSLVYVQKTMINNTKHYISAEASLEPRRRLEKCSLCESEQGFVVSKVDFWDLQTSELVQCQDCLHIQLDPKLTPAATSEGCLAYYIRESYGISQREQGRNRLRNFRRGVLFGRSLIHLNIQPKQVLECGPGDGFFLQGLKFVFPNIEITVLDIVEEVLKACREVHGYRTILGSPDSPELKSETLFDLIVARDVIEHVNDLQTMTDNLKRLLTPKGYFHFITPNGYEDVWGHFVLWKTQKKKSELLINHVNYFEGHSLESYLQGQGFRQLSYYTYRFKDALKGKGRKFADRWLTPARGTKTSEFLTRPPAKHHSLASVEEIYKVSYVSKKYPWLTYFVSAYHHFNWLRLSPKHNRGHEIFGLFQKN
ncbi:MAG: class I SAM-dependent methyltransferase [Bdellovibrionaceae bacterium]|nr:class I SAM-dependent methyltransferase [Pseudobdellovibrionaceae bacterium]